MLNTLPFRQFAADFDEISFKMLVLVLDYICVKIEDNFCFNLKIFKNQDGCIG